jgi:hypothetical protein
MPRTEFSAVQDRDWTPVELAGEAVPRFLSRIPRNVAHRFLASGQHNYATEGALIGGIDVYRHAPDDPVAFNKDWYAVRANGNAALRVEGPFKDREHWLDEVPERYEGIEVLGSTVPNANDTDAS